MSKNLMTVIFLVGCTPMVAAGDVIVNGKKLNDPLVTRLEKQFSIRIVDGEYWYDPLCGAWGYQNGPAEGFILPGMGFGGPLSRNASAGDTGVFINGRELHQSDVMKLRMLFAQVPKGRYWLLANGSYGVEGGRYLGNLRQMASKSSNTFSLNNYTGISSGSSSSGYYVMGKDWSVSVGL